MRVKIQTYSNDVKRPNYQNSRDYPNKTHRQVSNIVSKELQRAGWEEVAVLTPKGFQFKILGEEK